MILRLLIACFFVGSAIFFAEVARMNKWVSGERARKLIHILVGVWGAWLPWWLGWRSIILLGLLLIVGVFVASKLKFIRSIRSVSRSTAGEYFFPLAMILLAIFFDNQIIFAAAMLQMGLADGMAAVIGTRYGKKTMFKVFGSKKSKHGTLTFFVLSSIIIAWSLWALHPGVAFGTIPASMFSVAISGLIAGVLTAAELTGQKGLDNISVPMLTALALSMLQ
jgi:phytol kinase